MTKTDVNICRTFREMMEAQNPSAILDVLKKNSSEFAWDKTDLYLYSEDLGDFFFPKNSYCQFENRLREGLVSEISHLLPSVRDEFPWEERLPEISEKLGKVIDRKVIISPLFSGSEPAGLIVYVFEAGRELKDVDRLELDYAAAVIESSLKIINLKQDNEKLSIEKSLVQKSLVKAENLKLLGEMIGGITHDFNNILTGVTGFAQMLQLISDDEEVIDSVGEILSAANGGKKIVNFLSKTKKIDPDEDPRELDLCEIAEEAAQKMYPFLRERLPDREPEKYFSFDSWDVSTLTLPTRQVHQMFMHVFARLIKENCSSIHVEIDEDEGGIYVGISGEEGEASDKLPLSSETEYDFPGSTLLHELSCRLNFVFTAEKRKVNLNFITDSSGKPSFAHVKNSRILIFEPDILITQMLNKSFDSMGMEVPIVNKPEEMLEKLGKDDKEPDFIIADLLAYEDLVKRYEGKENRPYIILSSAWGRFLKTEEVNRSIVDRILLKPFNLKGLAFMLNRE